MNWIVYGNELMRWEGRGFFQKDWIHCDNEDGEHYRCRYAGVMICSRGYVLVYM